MRSVRIAVPIVVVLALASPAAIAGGGAHQPRANAAASVRGDFNGDGFADLAIGAMHEKVGAVDRAGAVHVLYGSADGVTASGNDRFTTEGVFSDFADGFSHFGAALAVGNFDGDGFADLAIGAPQESVENQSFAGVVVVFPGSDQGLDREHWSLFDERDFGQTAEPDDLYGSALASADFNQDGKDDLAIGGPGESEAGKSNAGVVGVLFGGPDGLSNAGAQAFRADAISGGVVRQDARFGGALGAGNLGAGVAGDLAVGAPGDGDGHGHNAGSVSVLYGDPSGLSLPSAQILRESSVQGAPIGDNDFFGLSIVVGNVMGGPAADLAIGAPRAKVGTTPAAGAVFVFRGSQSGLVLTSGKRFTPATPGVPDDPHTGVFFGISLAIGNFGKTSGLDLAVDSPFEVLPTGAGAVFVLYHGTKGITGAGSTMLTHSTPGIPGPVSNAGWGQNAIFAAQFGRSAIADLAVSALSENVSGANCGAAYVLYGRSAGIDGTNAQRFTPNSPGILGNCNPAPADTLFGQALG